jgi:hypothetical protein
LLLPINYFVNRTVEDESGSFGGIVSVYQRHNWMPEMRAAVTVWQAHLDSLLTPSLSRTGSI